MSREPRDPPAPARRHLLGTLGASVSAALARPFGRRWAALLGVGGVTAAGIAARSPHGTPPISVDSINQERIMKPPSPRLPVIYLPHGGGPWPFVDLGRFVAPGEAEALRSYLEGLPLDLPGQVRALLVVSAHWEEPLPTVMTAERPPMLYDYYGFPPASYEIEWPSPGDRGLATRVRELLGAAGIESAEDAKRGFDHGTFVPLKVAFPRADVPTVQLSLKRGLDPAEHIALGRALAPLRDEGVLIIGSGMSFHNLRAFGHPAATAVAEAFDAWLVEAGQAPEAVRNERLQRWAEAPRAREAHPREEHLLPLMVIAGAAGTDAGRLAYSGTFGGMRISALHYG